MSQIVSADDGVKEIEPSHLFRLIRDLVASSLCRTRSEDVFTLKVGSWTPETSLRDTGLGLDSMERMATAEEVAEFFNLYETGGEDYLLALDTLGEWVELVTTCLKAGSGVIHFSTSGSTGEPKKCAHSLLSLKEEAAVLADLFKGCGSIISCVPAHHIYGFLYTVLLPTALGGKDVVDGRFMGPGSLARSISQDDLVIATPTIWKLYERAVQRWPAPVFGSTSTEPMSPSLWAHLEKSGIKLTEIYGSSETAGIGSRTRSDDGFALFPYWQPKADGLTITRTLPDKTHHDYELQDDLDWLADGRIFTVKGRRDKAVQVAGHNVFPDQVKDMIAGVKGVKDCAVRFDAASGRLKALLVPLESDEDPEILKAAVRDFCAASMPSHQRPAVLTVRQAIPRNEMGKLQDWD